MKKAIFQVGDKVVALTGNAKSLIPREKGKVYKVYGVMRCYKCEEEMISISDKALSKVYNIKCNTCGCNDMSSNHVWTMSSNFALNVNLEAQLTAALANEDYELAVEIRDQMRNKS
jgi:hypothetical protein